MAQGFWRVWQASGREFGAKPVRYCSGGYCSGGRVTVVARSAPAAGLGGRLLAFLRAARFCACGSLVALAILTAAGVPAARAVEAVNVRTDAAAIDLTDAVDLQHTEGDRIQVSTAPGADAIVRRIEVRAREAGKNWGCSRSPITATSRSTASSWRRITAWSAPA